MDKTLFSAYEKMFDFEPFPNHGRALVEVDETRRIEMIDLREPDKQAADLLRAKGYEIQSPRPWQDARIDELKDRLDKLDKRSGLLSPSLSRQLWALFGRLVLLWIILGSVWLLVVIVALGLEGG